VASVSDKKLKLGLYWAAGCGGCDVAVLDIDEKILDVAEVADIHFWPIAMDFKYKDVAAMDDGFLDVCFLNGAIRNSENKEVAELLRAKSKVLVALGTCACYGGVIGLANFCTREEILETAFKKTVSTDNPEGIIPQPVSEVDGCELHIPEVYEAVYKLDDFVNVDYYLPGCPPRAELIAKAIDAIVAGQLPEPGSVLLPAKTVCDECKREKKDRHVDEFKRPWELIPDEEKCLLDQGLVCMGPATRAGCGSACTNVNMPCRGCYGPAEGVIDQGAKAMSAVAVTAVSTNLAEMEKVISQVKDPAGTFYMYGLPNSLLRGRQMKEAK
jgi:F420-non-reducing hydrogenase small subunit